MRDYEEYELGRYDRIKKALKKTKNWIDNNINYDHFKKKCLINDKNLVNLAKSLDKKKITNKKIKQLLILTSYSYVPMNVIKNFYTKVIEPKFVDKNKSFVRYYIFSEGNNIFISFRGTKTLWESINNLKFYRIKFDLLEKEDFDDFINWRDNVTKNNNFDSKRIPLKEDIDIEIHQGFLNEASKVYKEIINNLSELINPSCKITNLILCGHSLGGPVSTIIGIYLSYFLKKAIKLGKIEISLVSTNSPPIGNKNFNLLLPYLGIKNYVRFYNYQDFVPYYGYYGSWVDSKKFRHLDFMLKNGVDYDDKLEGRTIKNQIGNTFIFVKDFGKNLDNFLDKIRIEKKSLLNKKFIFHDFLQIDKKDKVFFI